MKIKACIFDLDGVIVDTAKYHYKAWSSIASELDIKFTIEDNERLKGVSRVGSLNVILELGQVTLDDKRRNELLETKNEIYLSFINSMDTSEILPGVTDFLEDTRSKDIKIGLGSASKNAVKILDQVNINHYFDSIVDGNDVINGKPNPEVFLKGASLLSVRPQECIVFEDSYSGIEAAQRGGFIDIGIGTVKNLPKANYIMKGFDKLSFNSLIKNLDEVGAYFL